MNHKKLQFLVPQYKETESVISFLLDSIEHQVCIDKNEIGVIICSDGGEYVLDRKFLDKYSYDIDYVVCSHRGVSATRNSAFLLSDADYVMYCDSDDGFCNDFGIKIIFENIDLNEAKGEPIDVLSSKFFSESSNPDGTGWGLRIMEHNSIYIHSRVYKRDFLLDNNIYFNENIWANEDCFFTISTNLFAKNMKLLEIPVYCWRNNAESVTHDPKYLMKTMHQLLYSNDSVVETMYITKMSEKEISKTVFDVICKVYLEMNKPCWYEPENEEYKDITIKTLKWYLKKRGMLCKLLTPTEKKDLMELARKSEHYANLETITFDNFINVVLNYGE